MVPLIEKEVISCKTTCEPYSAFLTVIIVTSSVTFFIKFHT